MNVARYQKKLLELEKTLSARTNRSLAGAGDQYLDSAHDTADASTADVAAENAFTQAELDAKILGQVRDALARIEDGTFGKCLADGEPIGANRLDAVPWAAYCVRHQDLIDAGASPRA